jgi:hypothetical protein
VSRARWSLLPVFAAWTLFVWATRIDNIWSDEALDGGQKLTRTALALSFVTVALLVGWVAARTFRRTRSRVDLRLVQLAAAWSIGVWVIRAGAIVVGDHDLPFIVVHVVLGVISAALAAAVVRVVHQAHDGAGSSSAELRSATTS